MAETSVTDLTIELDLLRARIDSMRGEVVTFLEEVGAPNLVEARDRFRRFATAAIELPAKIEKLQAVIANNERSSKDVENRLQLQVNASKELRLKASSDKITFNQTNKRLLKARAAMSEAITLLESPMYATFIDDSRPVIRSLDKVFKDIPEDLPVTEE